MQSAGIYHLHHIWCWCHNYGEPECTGYQCALLYLNAQRDIYKNITLWKDHDKSLLDQSYLGRFLAGSSPRVYCTLHGLWGQTMSGFSGAYQCPREVMGYVSWGSGLESSHRDYQPGGRKKVKAAEDRNCWRFTRWQINFFSFFEESCQQCYLGLIRNHCSFVQTQILVY